MALQYQSGIVENHSPNANQLRFSRRISMSDPSNSSATDFEETTSDLDSVHDTTISPSQSQQSSRTTSPSGPQVVTPRKSKTSGLKLSLKSLRSPRLSFHAPTDSNNENSPDLFSVRRSIEGSRMSHGYRASLELPCNDERTSFDSVDPRHSTSAPKASRLSFIHSTPPTPTGGRPQHQRSHTTPTDSNGSFSRRSSLAPKPVKETHTMTKEYDPLTGVKMINKYMVVKEIGRGVHGKVKLCRDAVTDKCYAIKIVDKTTRKRLGRGQISNAQKIRREIAIMKKCIHPNVVRLIEVIDDPNVRKIYLVLEYMEGGEVRWKDEDDRPILAIDMARSIFRDVVLGLEYLHTQGIIHRDIKPANLLLSGEGKVKISDFGVSHFSEKNISDQSLDNTGKSEKEGIFRRSHQQWNNDLELAKTAGSPAFFAPELCYASELSPVMTPTLCAEPQTPFSLTPPTLRSNPTTPTGSVFVNTSHGYSLRPPITKAIDVWALGVTLYCFVYGRCPFNAETEFELFNIIPKVQPSYDPVPGREMISPQLQDLLARLLEKDVSKRITLKEVKEHPWVIEDLRDPERWRIENDPSNYQKVYVTDEDVKGAVTMMDKLKKHIRRLSVSIVNSLNRKRSKSTAGPPESPVDLRSPTSITRSPPTTSQSMDHAVAQPQRITSPVSLPERFQKFNLFTHSGSNTLPRHADRLMRPNSAYSNASSIEQLQDDEDQGGDGSSGQHGISYVGRRRPTGLNGVQVRPQSYGGRPLSGGMFLPTSSSRSYSDEQLDGLYGRSSIGGMSFNGSSSPSPSRLSKSWLQPPGFGLESGDLQKECQELEQEPYVSHRTSLFLP